MIRRDAATTKSDCPNKQTTRRREWSEAPGSHLQVPEVAQRPLAQVSRHVAGLVEGVDDRLLGVVGHGGAPNVAKRPHRLRFPSGKGFRQSAVDGGSEGSLATAPPSRHNRSRGQRVTGIAQPRCPPSRACFQSRHSCVGTLGTPRPARARSPRRRRVVSCHHATNILRRNDARRRRLNPATARTAPRGPPRGTRPPPLSARR